jgi:hypothetical protein
MTKDRESMDHLGKMGLSDSCTDDTANEWVTRAADDAGIE